MTKWDLEKAFGNVDLRYVKKAHVFLQEEPKWRYIMKKSVKLAVTAAAVLLTAGVILTAVLLQTGPETIIPPTTGSSQGGEGSSQEPLRVCADLMVGGFAIPDGSETSTKQLVEGIFSDLKLYGGPEDVEVELIPGEGAARASALTRIRTEIMSGGGPDVFVCNCVSPSGFYANEGQALFPLPQKSMESGIFLPLDDYIPTAQYMEWDKLNQTVMEAGKTDEGQMLLPLAYTFPLTIFRAEDVPLPDSATTWEDVVSGNNPALSATSRWAYDASMFPAFSFSSPAVYSALPLGELADYKTDSLTMTQEELTEEVAAIASLASRLENGMIEPPAHFYDKSPAITFSSLNPLNPEATQGIYRNENLTFVPLYQKEGGAAVYIRAFAGINRNTKRPQDAFFLLDRLLSQDVQEHANLYKSFWTDTLPVLEGHTRLKKNFDYENGENFDAFLAAHAQIAKAKFSTELDQILCDVVTECASYSHVDWQNEKSTAVTTEAPPTEIDREKIESVVAEAYQKMKMMLAEA